jgi:hypothetical protein
MIDAGRGQGATLDPFRIGYRRLRQITNACSRAEKGPDTDQHKDHKLILLSASIGEPGRYPGSP